MGNVNSRENQTNVENIEQQEQEEQYRKGLIHHQDNSTNSIEQFSLSSPSSSSSSSSFCPPKVPEKNEKKSSFLYNLLEGKWRNFIPCGHVETTRQDEDEMELKFLFEEKHRTFWELVQRLLILNDVFVMINVLLEYIENNMQTSSCCVFLVDHNAKITTRISCEGSEIIGLTADKSIVGQVISLKTCCCLGNFEKNSMYDRKIDLEQVYPYQKLLCVPLMENGNVYAVIQATTLKTTSKPMDDLHLKLLTWLGPILSSCMRKCIEFHDVLLSERTQKALLHIISSSDTEDTVLNLVDGVIAGACHITRSERVTLFMIDWETQELWALSSSYHEQTLRSPLKGSILGLAATSRNVINVSDPNQDERFHAKIDERDGICTKCALYVPVGIQLPCHPRNVIGNSRPIAVLEILNKEESEEFTIDDIYAFEAFACEVAVILRRKNNEIDYIKLLADTRAEQVLAQRAKSQVNLLECYTSYPSTMKAHTKYTSTSTSERLRHSFFIGNKSHSKECMLCLSEEEQQEEEEQEEEEKNGHTTIEKKDGNTSSNTNTNTKTKTNNETPIAHTTTTTTNSKSSTIDSTMVKKNNSQGNIRMPPIRSGYKKLQSRTGSIDSSSSCSGDSTIDSAVPPVVQPFVSIPGWDFNLFEVTSDTLVDLIHFFFMDFNLDKILGISSTTIYRFILATKEKYHPNPFHNFQHAFAVLHSTYLLLSTTNASKILQPLDICGCLIAALCHDVDHPGHTNSFEVTARTQLALLYCDESVLERHHAYTTFRILSKEKEANLLENLSPKEYRHIRKVIVTAILGTDMASHFKFCDALEKFLHPSTHHLASTVGGGGGRENKTMENKGNNTANVTYVTSSTGPSSTTTKTRGHSVPEKGQKTSEIINVLRDTVLGGGNHAATAASITTGGKNGGLSSSTMESSSNSIDNNNPMMNRNFEQQQQQQQRSGSKLKSNGKKMPGGWVFNGTVDERLFITKTIVHAADLSGQVFPKHVALKWSNMIAKEFAYQALLEQAENLPVTYQHLDDPLQMVEGQLFFAQKIVAPLWDLIYIMFPETKICLTNLAQNILHYEMEIVRLKSLDLDDGEGVVNQDEMISIVEENLSETNVNSSSTHDEDFFQQHQQQEEGQAVAGIAKCTPAKFNSFRSIKTIDTTTGRETKIVINSYMNPLFHSSKSEENKSCTNKNDGVQLKRSDSHSSLSSSTSSLEEERIGEVAVIANEDTVLEEFV